MKARITITMNNASFDPHGSELARILRDLADLMEGRGTDPGDEYMLKDYNGNRVGECNIVDGEA